MKKIAFCFLIYESINQEEVWNNFFKSIDKNKYNIYIHFKNNEPLKYFENHKLTKCIETQYARISIVEAQNLLLLSALEDPENQHFIFLSNSCIPLKSFDHIYQNLKESHSYFNCAKKEHIFENGRGKWLGQYFKYVQKASQWSIINRKHALFLTKSISHEHLVQWFYKENAIPDEYIYITLLINNFPSELTLFNYQITKCTTFEYWDDKSYKFNNEFTTDHPDNWERRLKKFNNISELELRYLIQSPCFFARKFESTCTISHNQLLENYSTIF